MRLLLVGGTGLVGSEVLRLALADPRISHIIAPTRRPLPSHHKLENPVIDFDAISENASIWHADAVICTLGSTMAKAGSQQAFRRVDFDYPLKVARLALMHGARSFGLNSATGATAGSRFFYMRTKGEVEEAIQALHYPSLTIVRPSMIGGDRQEFRLAERVGLFVMRLLAPLIPKRHRIVDAERIAHSLLQSALTAEPGVHIIESDRI